MNDHFKAVQNLYLGRSVAFQSIFYHFVSWLYRWHLLLLQFSKTSKKLMLLNIWSKYSRSQSCVQIGPEALWNVSLKTFLWIILSFFIGTSLKQKHDSTVRSGNPSSVPYRFEFLWSISRRSQTLPTATPILANSVAPALETFFHSEHLKFNSF